MTTGQYVTYKLPYNYSDVGAQTYTLATNEVATTSKNGLMSATDKDRLDLIYSSLVDDDSNSVVDTLKEVLAVFNAYPEGATIANALSGKVDKTQTIAGIALSSNITAQAITDALVFATDSDIISIMED